MALKDYREMSRTMSSRSFQEPASAQTGCALMQLPVELRLQILRSLHRTSDRTIYTLANTPISEDKPARSANFRDNMQLSAQSLRCCQKLLGEAAHVLYNENVLQVECTFRRSGGSYCLHKELHPSIVYGMGGCTNAPGNLSDLHSVNFDYLQWIEEDTTKKGPRVRASEARFKRDWMSMHLFTQLHVNLDVLFHGHVFIAGRILEGLVRGKHVTIGKLPSYDT